ncbi:hypothetical protein L6164_028865 [Bauhinia variegata]|uniref:Uncharacterized protein n=1 Tax=Bauhinia variegata TaxID=167791 RepID=A0ACB9L8U4_BAUVA|nr:hypothetical protein L6164_028865 [Bauhinia variegata]
MELMAPSTLLFPLLTLLSLQSSSSSFTNGFSISAENPQDLIHSPNKMFSAGFHKVGENAYCFAIRFTEPNDQNTTVVWMANRDHPVNGKRSTLSLQQTGNLVLTDANQFNVWATNTSSPNIVQLVLNNDGKTKRCRFVAKFSSSNKHPSPWPNSHQRFTTCLLEK